MSAKRPIADTTQPLPLQHESHQVEGAVAKCVWVPITSLSQVTSDGLRHTYTDSLRVYVCVCGCVWVCVQAAHLALVGALQGLDALEEALAHLQGLLRADPSDSTWQAKHAKLDFEVRSSQVPIMVVSPCGLD